MADRRWAGVLALHVEHYADSSVGDERFLARRRTT
jgi:hypothetical protein